MIKNKQKEKKIARFYVMGETGLTVTDSQVFNWIDLLKRSGYPTSIISFVSEPGKKLDFEKINKRTGGQYYQYQNKNAFFSFIYFFKIFKKHYQAAVKDNDTVIFQTRTSGVAFSLLLLKVLTRAKIIYDARGLSVEESRHVNRGKKLGFKKAFRFNLLKINEWLMIRKANHVFCVSNSLKEYFISKYTNISPNKFTVVPCAADKADFYFDENERTSMREKFKLSNKKVLLYSGRLDKRWDIPEEILKFYIQLSNINDNLVLFLLTPDHDIVKQFVIKYNLPLSKIIVKNDTYNNVRKYLNMVDYGILLREDAIMNQVSSPTKFAEYLLCGLPVFISDTVFDYSKLILDSGFGIVVKDFQLKNDIRDLIENIDNINRQVIAEWAVKSLDKEYYIESIITIFNNI